MNPFFQIMLRAAQYAEEHLEDELTLDVLAGAAGFSKFHFIRLFKSFAKETVQEYIRKRRLTLAAIDLIETSIPVMELAVAYGYKSQEAFTRAFKSYMGISPYAYRKNGVHYQNLYKEGLTERILQLKQKPIQTKPRFVAKESFCVAGMVTTEIDNISISQLWNQFYDVLDEIPAGVKPFVYYGIESVDEQNQPYYLAGVEVETLQNLPDNLVGLTIPSNTYVVFELESLIDNIPHAIDEIYKVHLQAMQVKPVGNYNFEYYEDNFSANEGSHTFGYYVPIE